MLTRRERAWAEAIFAAVLPVSTAGVQERCAQEPSRRTSDAYWAALSTAAPTFGPGLRLMVWATMLLPLLDRRFLRPFTLLPPADRDRFVVELADRPGYAPRQLVATMKILACFACFDAVDDRALSDPTDGRAPRGGHGGRPPG